MGEEGGKWGRKVGSGGGRWEVGEEGGGVIVKVL